MLDKTTPFASVSERFITQQSEWFQMSNGKEFQSAA